MKPKLSLTVAVGVIRDSDDNFFIAKRKPPSSMPGVWEFPGGKKENDETIEAALIRELQEEVGIIPSRYQFLLKHSYEYDDRIVTLHVFLIDEYQGQAYGKEGQMTCWVPLAGLANYPFPPANDVILDQLTSVLDKAP